MDKEILDQLMSRDEKAFSSLIKQYSKLLWIVAYGILSKSRKCTSEDVEECVSDVFIELWQYPQKYDPKRGNLKTYLCLLVKSRALNTYRKRNRENVIHLDDHSENFVSEDKTALDTSDYSEMKPYETNPLAELTETQLDEIMSYNNHFTDINQQNILARFERERKAYSKTKASKRLVVILVAALATALVGFTNADRIQQLFNEYFRFA